jgi:hypothetical protein
LYLLFVADNVHGVPGGYSIPVVALTSAVTVALVILQLRHSWPSRGIARPRGWPVTLFLQAVLTYALVPLTGWHPLIMLGFLAGSALLLVPGAPGWVAFAAVIASLPVQWAVKPIAGLSTEEWLGAMVFLTLDSAALGLLIYGLTGWRSWPCSWRTCAANSPARRWLASGYAWHGTPMTSSALACPRSRSRPT